MKRTRLLFALIAFIAVIVMFAALRSKEGITEKECNDRGGTYSDDGGIPSCYNWFLNSNECKTTGGEWCPITKKCQYYS